MFYRFYKMNSSCDQSCPCCQLEHNAKSDPVFNDNAAFRHSKITYYICKGRSSARLFPNDRHKCNRRVKQKQVKENAGRSSEPTICYGIDRRLIQAHS